MGNGAPTVVLETGLGNDALIWSGIQATLAQITRVCAYDRAGFAGVKAALDLGTQTTSLRSCISCLYRLESVARSCSWLIPSGIFTFAIRPLAIPLRLQA